jgi:SAM-dependent methyltransferase
MASRCKRLRDELHAPQVSFEVGWAENLPYRDASFDVVVSYDVLEHVQDPAKSFLEIARVLREGGEAWLVFPSYLGALSAHLDYLTKLPALHRIFDPEVIISVVNEFLAAEPERYGTNLQPPPRMTPVGREALPSLNGMSLREAMLYVDRSGLEITWRRVTPMFRPESPRRWARFLSPPFSYLADRGFLPEILALNIVLGLRKPCPD